MTRLLTRGCLIQLKLFFSTIHKKIHSKQRLPEGLDEVEISKLMEVNESLQDFDVEVISANHRGQLYMAD